MIVTGDDFGVSIPVNEAITKAHQKGILTTTSLMVVAPASNDAVTRARSMPTLNVGLHLVLANGRPCLPPGKIPALVNAQGEFSSNQVTGGLRMFFLPGVRRQLEAEIRAQFEAFRETGLPLDHVNTHKHMHLHPTVLEMIIRIGKNYGMQAIRLPDERPLNALINSRKERIRRYALWLFLMPWVARMKKRLQANAIQYNDQVYGLHDSGHMHKETLVRILANLPTGLSEIYLHPATGRWDSIDP
ncbi:MAG: hypothetical protein A2W28_02260, partial [Gammaproteobacteria bacterium RBG_16_51_14]